MLSILSAKSYPGVIVTMTNLTLAGNDVIADSFNSSDPYHSTWQTGFTFKGTNHYGFYPTNPGSYTDPAAPDYATEPYWRKDNAYVESTGSIGAGNLNVCGYLDSGSGIPSIGPNGAVGDNIIWISGGGPVCDPNYPFYSGIQPGHLTTNFTVALPDVKLPNTNGAPWITVPKLNGAQMVIYGSTNIDPTAPYSFAYVITNGAYSGKTNYTISTMAGSSILVKGTNINLYLPFGLYFAGTHNTIWLDTNSDVTIYTGDIFDTTGNGNGINNIGRYAPAFRLYGLSTCTQIKLAGQPTNAAYIYAPEAEVDLVGGGSHYYDFIGAFYCNLMKMTGNMDFHYDEAMVSLPPKVISAQPTNQATLIGSNTTFTVSTTSGSPVQYQWFFNQTNPVVNGTNSFLTLTNAQLTNAGNYFVVLSNVGPYAAITSSIASLTFASPIIITQPTNQTVHAGSNVTFSVVASGAAPLSYEWEWISNNIGFTLFSSTNASASSLTLTNVQPSQAGQYFVRVTNAFGMVYSTTGILTVVASPVAALLPTNLTVDAGANVTFTVQASGTPPFSYLWRYDGMNIVGATNSNLALVNVQFPNIGTYSVIVSDSAGGTYSAQGVLNVVGGGGSYPPEILIQPANQIVHVGDTATFSVMVAGTQPLTYRWAWGWMDARTTTNAPILTIPNVQSTDKGDYAVLVTNAFGSVISSYAHLVVYTNLPAVDSVNLSTQGTVNLHITGDPGLLYGVEGSTNLTSWFLVQTNASSFDFTDTMSNSFEFYRVVIEPTPIWP